MDSLRKNLRIAISILVSIMLVSGCDKYAENSNKLSDENGLDIGTGTPFIFEFELDSIEPQEEFGDEYTYSVKVSEEENRNPFQLFDVHTLVSFQDDPFYFEDVNMDGYQDLMVDYYRAHNVSSSIFLWNSAQRKFVPYDSEPYWGAGYRLFPEKDKC